MSKLEALSPFETLYEQVPGEPLPLPGPIERIYGRLVFPRPGRKPYMFSNFVTSLDGVVTLGIPGHSGGGEISGFNRHDRFLMGLLRAVADVIIISSGILAVAPDQTWTPEAIYPPMAEEYRALRAFLGKEGPPPAVVITARGEINLDIPALQSLSQPLAILTSRQGALNLKRRSLPGGVEIVVANADDLIPVEEIIKTIKKIAPTGLYLMEAGPHLQAEFIAGGQLDEIFLTLAPQIAGRTGADIRPGLVADHLFAPDQPVWSTLHSIKRKENHLFLRYGITRR